MKANTKHIKELMELQGWSQNEFARKLNVSNGTVSRIFAGKRGVGRKFIAGLIKAFPNESVDKIIKFQS